jgi:hypothetical protein
MPPELSEGQVTIADIFRVLTSIQTDLGKMVVRLEVNDVTLQSSKADILDHETRLRIVERASIRTNAVAATVGTLAGAIAGILSAVIDHAH